jgi:alpha-amylase
LSGDQLAAWIEPAAGGRLYELDVRSIGHNLLATLCRRPEAYHQKVRAGEGKHGDQAASIHDRVVFKQAGLDQRLQYDRRLRKSLVDHFWALNATHEQIIDEQADELGDFADGEYHSKIRRNPGRVQVQLKRQGSAAGHSLTITKGLTLSAGSDALEIAYLIEGLPTDRSMHFGIEFNFSGLPAGADDRYFHAPTPSSQGDAMSPILPESSQMPGPQARLGPLQTRLDLHQMRQLNLCDEWLGIDVGMIWDRPTAIWTFPVETVSQSEGGFELVHQSVVVIPHWEIRGDEQGRWSMVMRLRLDTSLARSRASAVREMSST